jgi:polyribonucleotide nucleotidyltransferase
VEFFSAQINFCCVQAEAKRREQEAASAKAAKAAKKGGKQPEPAKKGKGAKQGAAAAATKKKEEEIEEGWEKVGEVKQQKAKASKAAEAKAAAAAQAADADGSVTISLGAHMGAVVGKKGAVIQRIQAESGAKMDINKDTATLKISGSADAVGKANVQVQNILEQEESIKANTQTNTIQAGSEKVKAVIGKKGATIQTIQSNSGAKVDANVDEGTVTISGSPEQVALAKKLVNDAMYGECQATVDLGKSFNVYLIMGTGGETIRRLQNESGAKFDLPRGSTTLTIAGSKEAVAAAKANVETLLRENRGIAINVGNKVGNVVGKQGAKVQQIQDACGVKCEIERSSMNDATVHVLGPPDNVAKAKVMIEKALSGEVDVPEGHVKETMDLGVAVSAIIGKGGEKVRELEATHGVKIDIVRNSGTCHVIGESAKVTVARAAIDEIVQPIIEKNQKAASLMAASSQENWSASAGSWGDANDSTFDASLVDGAESW